MFPLFLAALATVEAFPPPSGGSRIDKSTYACSQSAATNAFAWEMKYLPVEEADDDCANRKCTCGEQSRVALKLSSSESLQVGVSAGFGIHCTYAAGQKGDRAAANGGVTEEQLEERMANIIGDWSKYDTDANVRAWSSYRTGLWAESGLDWYVTQFKNDNVKHYTGSWGRDGSTYWSLLVLVPGTPVVLELQGSCTLCGDAATKKMPAAHLGRSGPLLARSIEQKTGAAAEQGLMSAVFVSRAVKDLEAVKTYYKSVFDIDPVNETTSKDGSKMADFQPGGTAVDIRYVQHSVTGEQSTEWFQDVLLKTAQKYQTGPSACWPIWGDMHYSVGWSKTTILEVVTAAGKLGFPYRSFAGSNVGPSNAYVVEPSGMWIQVNGDSTGLPAPGGFEASYCYTFCSSMSSPWSWMV